MKKTFAALALSLALPALAQQYAPAPAPLPALEYDINPGALQLTAKTGFNWNLRSSDESGVEDVENVKAGLGAMYYVSHFLGFGLDLDYAHHQIGDVYESEFFFGPKAGIDWELMKHFSVFADLSVGIARGETKEDPALDPDTGDGVGFGISAGFKLFLNRHVSLDLFGRFSQLRLDYAEAGKVATSDLSGGVALSIYLTNNPVNVNY